MKEDLSKDFGCILAISFALLVCVCAAMTLGALRERSAPGRKVLEGWLLEVVWINMPLLIVIALVLGWLFFETESGFTAATTSICTGNNKRGHFSSKMTFARDRSYHALSNTQGSVNYHLWYPYRQEIAASQ